MRRRSGHDSVDGHFFYRAVNEVRRHRGHDLSGVAFSTLEHVEHASLGGRHNGKTVAPTALVGQLKLVFEFGELNSSCRQAAAFETRPELRLARGIDRQRATPGSAIGQALAKPRDARQLLPLCAVPAHHPAGFTAVVQAQQRGHGFDLVAPGGRQLAVVARVQALGKRRIVLAVNREWAGGCFRAGGQLGPHGPDELAGRAVALYECHEPVRWQLRRPGVGGRIYLGDSVHDGRERIHALAGNGQTPGFWPLRTPRKPAKATCSPSGTR